MTFQLAIESFVIINLAVIGLSHLLCSQTWVEFFEWLHAKGRIGSFLNGISSLMERFSKKHLGRQVVAVIGGKFVTMHKVRSIIKDGELMISRCTDDGCRVILSRLGEMSKEQTRR